MSGKPQQTYAVDSRLPISASARADDPAHPKNITKNILMLEAQTTADTKYDIEPPPRLDEGFTVPASIPLLFIASIITIVVGIVLLTRAQSMPVKIALIVLVVAAIHNTVGSVEKCTVYK